jgi:DNA (cytosine-5)-methyltransferase 1
MGHRGKGELTFPAATHGPNFRELSLFSQPQPYVTTWEALSDLPTVQQSEGDEVLVHTQIPTNSYQRDRRGTRAPGFVFNHRATGHSQEVIDRYDSVPEGGSAKDVPFHLQTKKKNYFRLARDRPSRTVTCNHRTDILHPLIPRGTTVREAARLQSFDDDYQFFGNLTRKAKYVTQDDQVGNAVPPLLAEALARKIYTQLQMEEGYCVAAE